MYIQCFCVCVCVCVCLGGGVRGYDISVIIKDTSFPAGSESPPSRELEARVDIAR